jgi:hypothetical protein
VIARISIPRDELVAGLQRLADSANVAPTFPKEWLAAINGNIAN